MVDLLKTKAFVIHRENGFLLNFPNGNSISTIWGWGSYSETKDWHPDPLKHGEFDVMEVFKRLPEGSNSVEIMFACSPALQKKIEKKFNAGDRQPIGYLNISDWIEIINMLYKEKK